VSDAATAREGPTSTTGKGAATRARLMAAAATLFAEQGYDGTSVDAIATAAGITVPGMYRHFPNKASVLIEVARSVTLSSTARRALADGPDLPGRLADLFAEYTADGQVERRRLSIELSRAAHQSPELQADLATYNERLRGALRDTITAARPDLAAHPDEAALLAHLLLVLLMGAIHLDTLDATRIGDERFIAFLRDRLARVLDERPTAPAGPRTHLASARRADGDEAEPLDGRRRKAARTRRRILGAASELFALRGYDGATVDMIAAKAEITVPGLYRHVASKEELLVEVGKRTFEGYLMARPLGAGSSAPVSPAEQLAALVCAFTGAGDHVARRLAIELDFGAWRNPVLAEGLRSSHLTVRGNVARSLRAADPARDPEECEQAALLALILFMGAAHVDTVDPSLVDDPAWCDLLHRRMGQLVL
jgi:AcrR family transcriptional regulator